MLVLKYIRNHVLYSYRIRICQCISYITVLIFSVHLLLEWTSVSAGVSVCLGVCTYGAVRGLTHARSKFSLLYQCRMYDRISM